jgi:hypothetical protein
MSSDVIPLTFISEIASLSWGDVSFGFARGWLGWRSVVEHAAREVNEGGDKCPPQVIQLAALGKEEVERVGGLLASLCAGADASSDEATGRKWLFIRLSWLHHNRAQFENPLRELERICADFSYPSETLGLLSFMPPLDGYRPQDHTREENATRLYLLWERYLQERRTYYAQDLSG